MAKAGQAQEPSMEEILASIRRIISDDDAPQDNGEGNDDAGQAGEADMSTELSQDDLDKLFDSDGGGFDVDEPEADELEADEDFDMAAAMAGEDEDEDGSDADDEGVLELTEDFATEDVEDALEMVEGLPEDTDSGDVAFVGDEEVADKAFEKAETTRTAPDPAAASKPAPDPIPTPANDYKPVRDDAEALSAEARLMSDLTDSSVTSAFSSLSNTVLAANSRTLDELVREMLRPMIKAWLDDNLPTMVERMVRQEIERVTRGR